MGFSLADRRGWIGLALAFALTACGGGGSGGNATQYLPPASSGGSSQSIKPMAVLSAGPNNQLAVTGTIIGVMSNGFSIEGGASTGYFNVYTNSSTTYNSFTPAVGEFVEASGTGTPGSSLSATSVDLLSPASQPVTVSGQITSMIPGGFALASSGSTSDVYPIYSTTYTGAKPFVGENVAVSGIGSIGNSIVVKTVTQEAAPSSPAPAPTGASISVPAGVLEVVGQITSASTTRLLIQTGASCGYMYIYLNSSTTYFNGTPQVGQFGTFTGTGTKCSTITARSVSLSSTAPSTVHVTGTVAAATSYGFELSTAGTNVPVALSSSTVVFGGTFTVGATATVTAIGSTSAGLTATVVAVADPTPTPAGSPSPTPGPISTRHVMTAAMVYGYAGTPTSVPIGSIAPWVTWAQTSSQYASELRANGIKVDVYSNYWRNYASDNPSLGYVDLKPGGNHAAAEAKDCSGNVIYDSTYGGGYEADPRTSSALGHAQVVANYDLGEFGASYDALFADDSGAVGGITLPCGYEESSYDAAVDSIHTSLGVPIWVNALGGAQDPVTATDLTQPSNVLGAMCEECYSNNPSAGDEVTLGPEWISFENAEIGLVAHHKVFWDLPTASRSASETAIRIYQYASFLLTYDPSYAMFQVDFPTASGLRIFPEVGLVVENPITTQSSVSGYQGPGGAYMREFADCYYLGNFVNRCAVVVNPNSATVPVPTTSYGHSLVLAGTGVLDGGTAAFSGPAVTQLTEGTAAILFP